MYEPKQSGPVSLSGQMPDNLFKACLQSLPGAVAVIDSHEYRVAFANQHFSGEFGISESQVEEESITLLQLLEPAQHSRFYTHLKQSLYPEQTRKYVIYNIKNRSGELSNYYVYVSPVYGTGDTVEWYNVLFHPEMSKWALPFTSFDSREVYLEQFKDFGFGTFEWFLEEEKLYCTEGVYTIYELPSSFGAFDPAFVTRSIHPDDIEQASQIIQQALADKKPFSLEMRIITPNQNVKIINASATIVTDNSGNVVKLAGSIRDLTEQRRIEYDLKKNLEELNRSNKELEEFAYVASHDLQEPLRKITTFCSRIAEKYADKFDAEGSMYIERVLVSAENMRMLIHNLLEFSRVARDSQPFTSVNLSFVLHQVKADLELLIEETGATISYEKLPAISGSLTQLKQLFHNLIANAIKFRRKDVSPVIRISSGELSDKEKIRYELNLSARYYKISVEDNGIGFENQYATRIFQIFQRLHGKSEYPGTGIGLAICKKIVDHHHGLIFAEGNVEAGAVFYIILPEQQQ